MKALNVRILLVRNWWMLALRGLVAFVWPGLALAVLIGLFAPFAWIHGLFLVLLAVGERHQSRRWWLLREQGLTGIAVGIITFVWPAITVLALLFLVAAWAIVTGPLKTNGRSCWLAQSRWYSA
jgi:uncharacterized membrane protein HdeD (DUF308 family)